MDFYTACTAILHSPSANGYAKTYAKAGQLLDGEAARVQALYILSNITHWRAENAKQVRSFLKEFSKR